MLADVCDVEVVLPESVGDAVARGAAVLGRFAAEEVKRGGEKARERGQRLWEIMVRHVYTLF